MEIVVSKREIEIEIEKINLSYIEDGFELGVEITPNFKRMVKREIERKKRGETILQSWDREQQEFDDKLENTPIDKMTRKQLERLSSKLGIGGNYDRRCRKPQILSTIINHPKYIQKQRELTIEKILN